MPSVIVKKKTRGALMFGQNSQLRAQFIPSVSTTRREREIDPGASGNQEPAPNSYGGARSR